MSIRSRSPGVALLVVALALTASVTLAKHDASGNVDVFAPYPHADECGPVTPPGSYAGLSCPYKVCQDERDACETANWARWYCLIEDPAHYPSGCSDEIKASTLEDAKSVCHTAATCVADVCYKSMPANGGGVSCKVRSYYQGNCCCPTCSLPKPLLPL